MIHLTRTEEEKWRLAAELCETLNDLVKADPMVMHNLIETRHECNDAMMNHPTAQVLVQDGKPPLIGMLGLLNGLVGVSPVDGWGFIAGCYDDTTGQLTGFILSNDRRLKRSGIVDEIWEASTPDAALSPKDLQAPAPAAEDEGLRESPGDK